jgi:hypothetical protein
MKFELDVSQSAIMTSAPISNTMTDKSVSQILTAAGIRLGILNFQLNKRTRKHELAYVQSKGT